MGQSDPMLGSSKHKLVNNEDIKLNEMPSFKYIANIKHVIWSIEKSNKKHVEKTEQCYPQVFGITINNTRQLFTY